MTQDAVISEQWMRMVHEHSNCIVGTMVSRELKTAKRKRAFGIFWTSPTHALNHPFLVRKHHPNITPWYPVISSFSLYK